MALSTPFIRDKYILVALVAGVVLWLVLFGVVYVELLPLEDRVILHLDAQRHIDAIGGSAHLWLLLIGVAVTGILNTGLSAVLYHKDRVLSYSVAWVGMWIMLLGAVVGMVLVGIN